MQYRVVVRLQQQNILIWSWGVLILPQRNVPSVPASVCRTFTQQWGNLKHWEACKHLRLYSDTLLFHFQSSSIPSFQLTGEEEEESTAAFLWAWAVSGDGGKVGAPVPVLVLLLALLPWLGIGLPSPCHVLYIREDQQANLKVRWYQAHAKFFLVKKKKNNLPTFSFSHHRLILHLLHTCKSYVTCVRKLRERHIISTILIGVVSVKEQSRASMRMMFRLQKACQE